MTAREMKDSGVEWIGMMPNVWSLKPLKHCVNLKTTKSKTKTGYVGLEQVKSWEGRLNSSTNQEAIPEGDTLAFTKGDVLFGKLRPYLAKCFFALHDGSCSTEFLVLKPITIDGRFLKFSLLTSSFIDTVNMSTNGVKMPRANWDFIGTIKMPIPDIKEQLVIANFLDTKCAEIDSLTADIEKQIETLQEYKKSVITEAVTKGLNPNVEMEDSGVEWLEPIPNTWSVKRLKQVLENDLQYGAGESGETDIDGPKLRYIRITDISSNGQLKEESVLYLPMHKAKFYVVKEGDILFARSGATVGKTYFHKGDECCFAGYLIKCSIKSACCHPRFFYYFTKTSTYENWKDVTFSQATIQNINAEKLANLYLPIPDYHEQIAIVDFLDAKCEVVDNTIQEKQKQLEILAQYKQSLIYEYVTGKKAVPT